MSCKVVLNSIEALQSSQVSISPSFDFRWSKQGDIVRYLGGSTSLNVQGLVSEGTTPPSTGGNSTAVLSFPRSPTAASWTFTGILESSDLNIWLHRNTRQVNTYGWRMVASDLT